MVIAAAWNYYTKNTAVSSVGTPASLAAKAQPEYRCDGRQHCSQMTSYEEAKYFLENCPDTKMDGDGDGIPCERQFGR
jgi:hypothetical protein